MTECIFIFHTGMHEYSLEREKSQSFCHLMGKANSLGKTLMLGKIEGGRRREVTKDEMVGWHH